jgi:hypothetical protein
MKHERPELTCTGDAAPNPLLKRPRRRLRGVLALTAALSLATVLAAATASATDLLEGRVTAGAETVLQNGGGTLRLEQPQLDATDRPTFFVPEPGALAQLGSGVGMLALLHARRRRVASRPSSAVGG